MTAKHSTDGAEVMEEFCSVLFLFPKLGFPVIRTWRYTRCGPCRRAQVRFVVVPPPQHQQPSGIYYYYGVGAHELE